MQPPMNLSDLESTLSVERLAAYSSQTDNDHLDAISRYLWNQGLTSALLPIVHTFEVALRNHLFVAMEKKLAAEGANALTEGRWLDRHSPALLSKEREKVRKAYDDLRIEKRKATPGRVLSKLSLGFWTALCSKGYEQGQHGAPAIWPGLLKTTHGAFPHLVRRDRNRGYLRVRIDEIRRFRNRLSHHDPIWDRSPNSTYLRTIEVVGWMNPGVAKALSIASRFDEMWSGGPEAFRPLAERLIRL